MRGHFIPNIVPTAAASALLVLADAAERSSWSANVRYVEDLAYVRVRTTSPLGPPLLGAASTFATTWALGQLGTVLCCGMKTSVTLTW